MDIFIIECTLSVFFKQEGLQLHDAADRKGFQGFFDGFIFIVLLFNIPLLEIVLSRR